jgi:hypothetical protein
MRKLAFGFIAVMAVLAGSATSSHAWWQGHGGWRGPVFVGPRVVIGVPFGVVAPIVPFIYAPPVVAVAPPVVMAPPAPPVYAAPAQPSWYYCQSPPGYYPSVPQCPGGWLQLAPQQ